MKHFLFAALFTTSAILCAEPKLIVDGKSDYTVVLPSKPTPVEVTAAKELVETLKKITGLELKTVRDSNFPGKAILIGADARTAKILGVDFSKLKPDEIILKTVGDNLVLAGEKRAGTLYAVFEYLESLGYRRWTHRDEYVPELKKIELKKLNYRYAPPFIGRDRLGGANGKFGAWMRVNGHYLGIPSEYGGVMKLIGWCHTFGQMIPARTYFKDHPEYFALANGQRGWVNMGEGEAQLCLSNPAVRNLLKEKTLELLRKEKNPSIISVSQNDAWGKSNENYCHCEKCSALDTKEGAPSASVISVVNEVAEAVEKEFPDVLVETLAYHYTLKPPKTLRPRRNVIIRFCTRNNFLYPWDSPENAECRENFSAWSRIAPKMYVWNYTTNFANVMMPHPNIRNYASDLRFMVKNNVIAVLEQGYGQGLIPDLAPLHTYLTCKLMWNPELDQEKLTDEFLNGYYGKAAPFIREYMNASYDIFLGKQLALGGSMMKKNTLTTDDLLKLKEIYNKAENAVKDVPDHLLRVKTGAMSVNLPLLYSDAADIAKSQTQEGKSLRSKINLAALASETRKTYQRINETERWKEDWSATIDKYIDSAEARVTGEYNAGRPIPKEFKDIPKDRIRVFVPSKDFSIWKSNLRDDGSVEVGNQIGWRLYVRFHTSHNLGGKMWRIMMSARTSTNSKGTSFSTTGDYYGSRVVSVSEIQGNEYKYVDLGTFRFPEKNSFIALFPSGIEQKLEMRDLVLIRQDEPEICKGRDAKDFRILSTGAFNCWHGVTRVADGFGESALIPADSKPNGLQIPLPALKGEWNVAITMRAESSKNDGNAVNVSGKGFPAKMFTLKEIGGKDYKTVGLGKLILNKPTTLVFNRSWLAEKIFVKEVILYK